MIACVNVLHIDPAWRERLRAAKLDSMAALLDEDTGRVFKRKPRLEVRRLTLPQGETCYLKRTQGPPLRAALRECLRAWRRASNPHTEAFHVARSARTLATVGIPTMAIAAWGERRFLGFWPVRGFVLAGAVEGLGVLDSFRDADPTDRRLLMRHAGCTVGRLYAHGLFVVVRLHDLIATRPVTDPRGPDLVMIDLDFKGHEIRVGPFKPDRCPPFLAQCAYLLLRAGDSPSPLEFACFLDGFRAALRHHNLRPPRGLVAATRRALRHRLADHHADPDLVAMFPKTPPTR